MPIPIYQEHGKTFQADTCAPVSEAVRRRQVRLEALVRGHYPGRKMTGSGLHGVKTIGFWDASSDQDWGLDWHRNEGIELTFLESGNVGFAVDRQTCLLRPDDLTITRPWQRHRVGNPCIGRGRLHWLILDVGVRRPDQQWRWPSWIVLTRPDLQELTHVLRHTERPVWRATPAIRQCFQNIARAVEGKDAARNISRLAAYINELFVLVLEMCRTRPVKLDKSLSSTQRTVELFWGDLRQHREHLAEPWTVGMMAEQCGLGVTQFIHLTKKLTNMTPVQYLTEGRLEMAAKLLKDPGRRSVLDVALDCGFSSSQYFANLFRKQFGSTPRDFRQTARA
jgi:AraC family L-rhamnose operon regulatory protein RhaS